jgi:plasmid stability protein
MGQILIRKLDDKLIKKIKARAKANRRSAEAEVREILLHALGSATGQLRVPLSELIGAGRSSGRTQEDIDRYVRELRDEWER